jgi:hypothetical protein
MVATARKPPAVASMACDPGASTAGLFALFTLVAVAAASTSTVTWPVAGG